MENREGNSGSNHSLYCGSTKQYRSLGSLLVKTAGGIERLGYHAQNKVHLISDVFSDLRKTLPEKSLALALALITDDLMMLGVWNMIKTVTRSGPVQPGFCTDAIHKAALDTLRSTLLAS